MKPFIELETLEDMSKVAKHLAISGKATKEIEGIRQKIHLAPGSKEDVEIGMHELAFYLRTNEKKARMALVVLKAMRGRVQKYLKDL